MWECCKKHGQKSWRSLKNWQQKLARKSDSAVRNWTGNLAVPKKLPRKSDGIKNFLENLAVL